MSIKCGSCGGRHESIADVRACSEHYASGAAVQDVPTTTLPDLRRPQEEERATERQVNFMLTLERQKISEPLRKTYGELEAMSKKDASAAISELLKRPNLPGQQENHHTKTNLPDVPAGRYAIGTPAKFYRVDRPTEGRWAGYTFVKVQASDEWYNVNRTAAPAILQEIAKDPQQAMKRYGLELGRCGHCGRTLTDPESIAAGIGPICAGKMGWGRVSREEMDNAIVPDWTLS